MSKKVLAIVLVALFVSSCSAVKKSEKAIKEEVKKEEMRQENVETVYFDFDQAVLKNDAQKILNKKVLPVVKTDELLQIKIEGHCDERGTNAYNRILCKKRAEAVKKYLIENGVKSSRIKTVSYGKTKPVDMGHNEEAWAKNRRAVTISAAKKR